MAVVLGEPSTKDRSIRAASLLEHGFQHYGWKTFFDPTDIDNLPMDKDAKPVVSIRDRVLSWACGYRPKAKSASRARRLRERRAARAKLRRKKKSTTAVLRPKLPGTKAAISSAIPKTTSAKKAN
jgi:D-alanyl-D-alanine carboxypeptidase